MKTDLLGRKDGHQSFFSEIRNKLNVSDESIKIYRGTAHALSEVTKSLAQMFGHKKSYGVLKGTTPFFEPLFSQFSREGMHKQEIETSNLQDPQKIVEGLKKDTLFVLIAEDDPLTGELFNFEPLEKLLSEKKIFSIRVSHHKFLMRENIAHTVDPFAARILSVNATMSVALIGSRIRLSSLVAGDLVWEDRELKLLLEGLRRRDEFKSRVLGFEKLNVADSKPYFSHEDRLFDRAVIVWTDMDASAMAELLSEKMQWIKASDNHDSSTDPHVDTSSPCRWGLEPRTQWLLARGLSKDELRGLLILDASKISEALIKKIEECRSKILKMQNG